LFYLVSNKIDKMKNVRLPGVTVQRSKSMFSNLVRTKSS